MSKQQIANYMDEIIKLDVEGVLLDRKFGDHNFKDCIGIFRKAQEWAIYLKNCDHFDVSSEKYFDSSIIIRFFESVFREIEQIRSFDPINHRYDRDQIINRIRNSFGISREIEKALSFLRLVDKEKILDEKLAKVGAAKDISASKKALTDHAAELKVGLVSEREKILSEILSLKEAQAAKSFSEYFSNHSASYDKPIRKMVRRVRRLRVANYTLPLVALGFIACKQSDCFKSEVNFLNYLPILVLFSVFMSLVFYHLKSTTRDLNILKNAKESHEHRAKVAETFIAFLASQEKDEIAKAEMAKQAAIAMFQRVPSGYLTKDQIEPISHPLAEILLKRK